MGRQLSLTDSQYNVLHIQIKSNQIKFISKCKNRAHSKHVMHLGGTARRIALTAAQCYSVAWLLEFLEQHALVPPMTSVCLQRSWIVITWKWAHTRLHVRSVYWLPACQRHPDHNIVIPNSTEEDNAQWGMENVESQSGGNNPRKQCIQGLACCTISRSICWAFCFWKRREHWTRRGGQ